jgi:hypothetical protein
MGADRIVDSDEAKPTGPCFGPFDVEGLWLSRRPRSGRRIRVLGHACDRVGTCGKDEQDGHQGAVEVESSHENIPSDTSRIKSNVRAESTT